MKTISDFIKGVRMAHVDYATRHYSRIYDAGTNTGVIGVIASPFVFCLVAGFLVGRYS
jgi:hypothetical protein